MSGIMNKILVIGLLFLLIIACTDTDTPTANIVLSQETQSFSLENYTLAEVTIPNLCKEIKCNVGEYCVEGECVCAPNYKDCRGKCVPIDLCCLKTDCATREDCINFQCIQVELCGYLEKWDAKSKTCVCQEGAVYCAAQNKCIPIDHCCIMDHCNPKGGNERYCVPTDFKPYICIKKLGNKGCNYLSLIKERNSYTLLDENFDLFIEKIFENNNINIRLAKNSTMQVNLKNFKIGEKYITPFAEVSYEGIEVSGGNCRSAE